MQTVSIILAIIFAAVSAGAEEIRIGEPVEVFTHNSVLKRHTKSILQVKYDTKANSYYLVTADSMTVSNIFAYHDRTTHSSSILACVMCVLKCGHIHRCTTDALAHACSTTTCYENRS